MAKLPNDHAELLNEALALEGEGQRLLLAGDPEGATAKLGQAADRYRRSWQTAPPGAYGRLVGMLKAAVIAGGGEEEAAYTREQLHDDGESPTSWYALAVAALVDGDHELAARAAEGMRGASEPFDRTANAIAALAAGNRDRYAEALRAIVADFEAREEHLTGVPIADTALMLEELARRRGLAAGERSRLLPR